MCVGPVGFSRVAKSYSQEEGVEALFATGKVIGSIGAGATQVSNGLIKDRRDANRCDVAITKEFGNQHSIAFVGFNDLVGFTLGLGRSHQDAIDFELAKSASQDEPGGSGLVADLKVLELLVEEFGELA